MRKFFISSHGKLASGMRSSLAILLGKVDSVTTYDAYLDDTTVEEAVEMFYESINPTDQVFLLSDLYGGSVNQTLYRYSNKPNTILITGINLALVLELVSMSDMPIGEDEVDRIIETARFSMKRCTLDVLPQQNEEFF